MSGITSTGLISGIDSAGLIEQLLSISARPRTLAQRRAAQLQSQQAAFLEINSRLTGLRSASQDFRTSLAFLAKTARSSNENVVTATATNAAQPGSYGVLVDRLASTQQFLTRGFQDRNSSPFGATSFTFETAAARVDQDTRLSELNGGDGVRRGRIEIEDQSGETATIDLSRAATLNEVVQAINDAETDVRAEITDQGLRLTNVARVESLGGGDTAEDLGLDISPTGGVIETGALFYLSESTALSTLNDGNGVDISGESDINLRLQLLDGGGNQTGEIVVNLGTIYEPLDPDADPDAELEIAEAAPTSLGGVVDRINAALQAQGLSSRATIGSKGIEFNGAGGERFRVAERNAENNTARDLGILDLEVNGAGTVAGRRILSGLNTTLLTSLSGGGRSGVPGNGIVDFTLSDDTEFAVNLSSAETLAEAIDIINAAADAELGGNADLFTARLSEDGLGIEIVDELDGGAALVIQGTVGDDTAAALGISTGPSGVASGVISGNTQRRYISEGTLLSSLNGGEGIGTGTIEIVGSNGTVTNITIDSSVRTIRDLIDKFGANDGIETRINDNGDGLLITGSGGVAIEISDVSGTVAQDLRIAGLADLDGAGNQINGSFETTVEFETTDTLNDAVRKINESNAGVSVSVLNDGSGARPFRLSIVANSSGEAGRVVINTNGFNLGLNTVSAGDDARAFLGSGSPSTSLLLTSPTNSIEGAVEGVTLNFNSTSDTPTQINVEQDVDLVVEKIESLITSFNGVLDRIDFQSRYVEETEERGPLLGDGTLISLRGELFNVVNGRNVGFNGGFDQLAQIGLTVGEAGKLEFDSTRFREALRDDPQGVEDLFTRRTPIVNDGAIFDDDGNQIATVSNPTGGVQFSELGVIPALEELVNRYSNSVTGVLTLKNQSIDSQIQVQNNRIESLSAGLERERERLSAQFLNMERVLAGLQQQQAALASLSSFASPSFF